MSGPEGGGYSEEQLWDLLGRAYEMPYGAAQIALVEQVIGHADASALTPLAFAARMQGTSSYVYGGEPARAVVTFSWCLAEFDRDPVAYQRHQRTLLWHFKYMVNALTRFPEVPLERTYAVLDDMERRWRDTGHTPHAVYAQRHHVARHIGDVELAEDYYTKWCTTPRDDLSDCIGCDPSSRAWWLASRGRDEEAVALAEPVLAGTLTCTEQPQGILTNLLLPYLRTGRLDQARDAHRRAYRLHRPNLADLGDFAEHMEFCARTGNAARGVEILERHLGWLDRAPSPYSAMSFAAAGALVLRRAVETDADLTLHRPAFGDRAAATVSGAQLGAELAALSLEVAARFDARNQTSNISGLVHSTLDAAPLVEYLPLSPTAPRDRPVSTVVDASASPGPAPSVQPALVPTMAGPDDLLDHIEELHRLDEDADLALAAFDERYPVDGLSLRQRARRGAALGVQLADAGDLAGAETTWRAAAADYAMAGDSEGEQKSLARTGLVLCESGRADEGIRLVTDATDVLLRSPSAQVRCDAVVRFARSLSEVGRHDEAIAALARADAWLPETPTRTQAAFALSAMMVRLRAHHIDDIRALGDDLVAKALATGDRKIIGGAHAAYGAGLELVGDLLGAAEQLTQALAAVDDPEVRRGVRFVRGNLLAHTDRAADALDDLTETVADRTAASDPGAAADARHALATAYLNLDRLLDAAEVAEEELAYRVRVDQTADGAPSSAIPARHLLATIYQRLAQPDDAIAQLDAIGLDCARLGNHAGVGQMARESADILDRLDRDDAAANRYLAAAEAYRALNRPLDELYNRRRYARSVFWAHGAEHALPVFESVTEFAVGLPETLGRALVWERATLDYDAARMLWGAAQLSEAARRAEAAAEAYRGLDRLGAASDADVLRADILLADHQPAAAEAAARQALAELPAAGNRRRAIQALAAALDAQDRPDEAAAARAELT